MKFNKEIINGFGVALNESVILEFQFDKKTAEITILIEAVHLNGEEDLDKNKFYLKFENVGRFAALLKLDAANDDAEILKLSHKELSTEISNFKGESMYGWEFMNTEWGEKEFDTWKVNTSLDITLQESGGFSNTIDMFSEHFGEQSKTVDLRIWFDDLEIRTMDNIIVSKEDFINRGKKVWDGIYSGKTGGGENSRIIAAVQDTVSQNSIASLWKKLRNLF